MENKPQPNEAGSEKPRRVIKRYSNRKLYDTKDSRYVTLIQIAEMVRAGEQILHKVPVVADAAIGDYWKK